MELSLRHTEPPEEINPADALVSDLRCLKVSENKHLLSKNTQFVVVCSSCPRKLMHLPSLKQRNPLRTLKLSQRGNKCRKLEIIYTDSKSR